MDKKFLFAAATLVASITSPIVANAACSEFTSSNPEHISAGRAYVCNYWYVCATGSDENIGMNYSFVETTLKEDPAGYFSEGTCPINVGEAPEVGSWGLQIEEPNFTAVDINVSDVDGDLQTLEMKVTNSRNDNVTILNCSFDLVEGSTVDYLGAACDTYVTPQWGNYTFTPVATDAQGNVTEGESATQRVQTGSSKPILVLGSYNLEGTVLTVTGTASDIDGDLDRVLLGVMPAFGMVCEGPSIFTCVVDTAEHPDIFIPGNTVGFDVFARDSVENMSNMEQFTIVIPEPVYHAPTIDTHEYTVSGNTITFTGTASDLDGDLDRVILTLGAAGGIVCDGAANFTCVFEAPGPGMYTLGVVAVDSRDVFGEVAGPYEIVISDQECYTATNQDHIDAGRAELKYNVLVYALGSGDYLGMTTNTTSLELQVQPGNWVKVDSCQ